MMNERRPSAANAEPLAEVPGAALHDSYYATNAPETQVPLRLDVHELLREAVVPGNGHGPDLAGLVSTFRRWIYLPDPGPLYVTAAAVLANYGPGDPVWAILIGPPGGGKTELLRSHGTLPHVYQVSTLTEGSLLSGTSKKERASDSKGGLLREIGDFGILLLKDFGSILSLNKDARGPILMALREVYDGSWVRHVGTDGGRALHWEGRVGMIAGATPAIDAHHAVISQLGERFCYYRLPDMDERQHALGALAHCGQEETMRASLTAAVHSFFDNLELPREHPKISDAERDWLISVSRMACRCRAPVMRDPHSREVEVVPGAEAPTRLTLVLAKLLDALARIGVERRERYELVLKVARDSMPALRLKVMQTTTAEGEWLKTSEVAQAVGEPTQTTRRALEDLSLYGMLYRESGGDGRADRWTVTDFGRELWQEAATVPDIWEGV